ncbi:6-phosphofructo-2-kinase, partial [Teladorsagia circumcincta]
ILDATNTTRARRRTIIEYCRNRRTLIDPPFRLFFVESVCDDPAIINSNITEVKINSPDYKGIMSHEDAKEDFLKRIENYKLQYEPLDQEEDEDLSFIKEEDLNDLRVWSSQRIRAVQTAEPLSELASHTEYWKVLDEIDA